MIVPDWLSLVADVASVIGLLVTLAVWFQTKALRKAFTLRGRLPALSSALKDANNRIFNILQQSDTDVQRSGAELARLREILNNLSPKLMGNQRESVVQLLRKCNWNRRKRLSFRSAQQRRLTSEELWEIYNETEGLIESLRQTAKDFEWG